MKIKLQIELYLNIYCRNMLQINLLSINNLPTDIDNSKAFKCLQYMLNF